MKIAKYGLVLALGAMSMGVTGCSDFLNVEDESSISDANFPTNMKHVDLLLNSAYAGSHGLGLYGHTYLPEVMYLLDHSHDVFGNYDGRSQFLSWNAMTSNEKVEKTYGDIMCWIQYANSASDACDSYRPNAAENELDQLDYMQGQALFQRALAYWHAQIFFELESKADGLGFPIIDHAPETIDQMMPQRASVKDTWEFVAQTLEKASELMEGHNSEKADGRVTYWAARGLLAKVYMQARQPEKAIPVLEDIFAHSGAKLLDFDTYSKSFYADELYEFNQETFYEIDMTRNMKQEGPWAGFTSGSGQPMVMAPWLLDLSNWTNLVNKSNGKWKGPQPGEEGNTCTNGGWGNNYVNDYSVKRFGWTLTPTARVQNKNFKYKGTAKFATVDNYPFILPEDFKAASKAMRDNKECDPRLFVSAAQPYYDTLKDKRGEDTWYDVSFTETLQLGPLAHLYFAPKKFTNLDGPESALNMSSGANYPQIRLADLYLLYAEAIAKTNPTKALEYVNKVHRRAYGQNPDAVSAYDYKSLTDETMAAKCNAQDILGHDVIKYERFAEMFAEGQWFYDVRRWEILQNEIKVYPTSTYGSAQWIGERQYCVPIPLKEIENYNGNLQQNYNY